MGSSEGQILAESLAEATEEGWLRFDLIAPAVGSLCYWRKFFDMRFPRFQNMLSDNTYNTVEVLPEPKLLSETVSCSLYIPLLRNQGEAVQKGQQFDLRGLLEEFKHEMRDWKDRKPGMEIEVSLVRRKQIPSYLFTKTNHNKLQQATNRCAVENEVGLAVDIGRTIM